jgi:RHS repeat-associated protein
MTIKLAEGLECGGVRGFTGCCFFFFQLKIKSNLTASMGCLKLIPGIFLTDEKSVSGILKVDGKSCAGVREVYFDDFKVTHTKSPVLEENFYYPFGMIAQRNSREGMTEQSYLYNGKELQDELDLGWFDYGARMYQPEIARWNGVDASSENYVNQSPYHYAGNNPVIFVDYDGNDYGVSVNHSAKTITIQAHFLVSGANKAAFDRRGSGAWNSQSGKNVFVAGGLKALRNGNANTYKININVTSEVVEGAQSGRGSDRDKQAVADKSGTVNSFDSSEKGFEPNQNGGTVNRKVDVKEGKVDSGTTTHEVSHALGNGHTDHPNGTLGVNSGESVGTSQVAETLAGVGIGGNNIQRNATGDNRAASIGDGTMLNNSTNSGLESGKVITENRYNRIIRRIERREERQNR